MTTAAQQPTLPLARTRRGSLLALIRSGEHDAALSRWQSRHAGDRTPTRLAYDARSSRSVVAYRAAYLLARMEAEWRAFGPRELRGWSWAQVYDALRRAGKLHARMRPHTRTPNAPHAAAIPPAARQEPEPSPRAAAPAPPVLYEPDPDERALLLALVGRRLPSASLGQLTRCAAVLVQ